MKKLFAASVAVLALFAAPAQASVSVTSGTRAANIGSTGPIGQSFVADSALFQSFGFQFAVANSGVTDASVTFRILEGAGLAGTVLATRTATLSSITGRTLTWYDFDLGGLALTAGQSYTAVMSAASTRLALGFGPNLSTAGVPASGDAYAAGRLLSTGFVDGNGAAGYCATSGACDANFRFTSAAAAAVPEPGTWLLMLGGLGLTGAAIRRRAIVRVAAA